LSHQLLLEQILKGERPEPVGLALAGLATCVIAAGVVGVTVWRYDRQRVLFGSG
jgi:hypothetical protein